MPTIHPVVDEGLGNGAYLVDLGHGRALAPAKFPDGPVTLMCADGERATGQALARS
jgi:hypothetical protein